MSPAINDTLSAYRPTLGTSSLNSVEIRRAVPEIFVRERKRVRSAGNGVSVGEVRKTTTVSLSTITNSACASQIRPKSDSPSLRNAPTDRQTDRQTDRHFLYIYIDKKTSSGRPTSVCLSTCNSKAPIYATLVSDRCEMLWSGRDRESETNGRIEFRLDCLRQQTLAAQNEMCRSFLFN